MERQFADDVDVVAAMEQQDADNEQRNFGGGDLLQPSTMLPTEGEMPFSDDSDIVAAAVVSDSEGENSQQQAQTRLEQDVSGDSQDEDPFGLNHTDNDPLDMHTGIGKPNAVMPTSPQPTTAPQPADASPEPVEEHTARPVRKRASIPTPEMPSMSKEAPRPFRKAMPLGMPKPKPS